ncbi:MAG: hypothetical protein H6708_17570 [Kofleriaceae bacterium]|nr:hypothetical protein [Myxococcales bacterium]MCB9562217.1 hypothetical protein [Kofleriaceae bacterium]
MRLDLPIPDGWAARRVDAGLLVEAPGAAYDLLVLPMGPAPPDPERWLEQALVIGVPDARAADDLEVGLFRTDGGWEGVFAAGVVGAEHRFAVYLAFLDYAAGVVGTCRTPDAHPGWRDELLACVQRARPDFSDDALHGLHDVLGQPPPGGEPEGRHPTPIAGWQRTFVGGAIVLSRIDHPGAGLIRVELEHTPVRAAASLFGDRPWSVFVTDEGEHAVIGTTAVARGQRTLAVVYGAASCVRIEATVGDPAHFDLFAATARELAYRTTLGLGDKRWRPYYFEPPAGWTGIARPHHTLWVSPLMPGRYQLLRVFDARPPIDHDQIHGARMFETLAGEYFREPPRGPAIYYTAEDHECRVFVHHARFGGRELHVLDGQIVTPMYVYPLRIEYEPALGVASAALFEQLVATVRLVPGRRPLSDAQHAVDHWAE